MSTTGRASTYLRRVSALSLLLSLRLRIRLAPTGALERYDSCMVTEHTDDICPAESEDKLPAVVSKAATRT